MTEVWKDVPGTRSENIAMDHAAGTRTVLPQLVRWRNRNVGSAL